MILDFRYHIFTIAAIFAALGLGILIGSSLIGDETLVNEQKKLITNINEEMKKLREENDSLEASVERYKEDLKYRKGIEKRLLELGLADTLQDNNYILLNKGWLEVDHGRARAIFEIAGAQLNIKSNLTMEEFKGDYKIIFKNKNNLINNFGQKIDEISDNRLIKIKSRDIVDILVTLIEREKDAKNSISNNTGL